MKTKKPILIVCAAALTLALALPFMGVFAFADEQPSLTFVNLGSSNENLQGSFSLTVTSHSTSTVNVSTDILSTLFARFLYSGSYFYLKFFSDEDLTAPLSVDRNNPSVIESGSSIYFNRDTQVSADSLTYYFEVVVPVPPDPLAPVSDGIDASINIFGQVIDYVVNTPSVAVFAALSVAAFAIVPAGIVIIKKLIKGY